MKKIMWFSRHMMTGEQISDLRRIYGEEIEINQVNRTVNRANEVRQEIESSDIIAVVAPLPLQKEFLELAGEKPVIFCKNERIVDPADNSKVTFSHGGWFRIERIDVVFKPL